MTLAFFEIGFGEMLVVGFIALLLFGGDLPRVMRSLGGMYRNFRKSVDDLKVSAMRPDLTAPAKPTAATPYRPSQMPLPPPAGVSLTPPAMPTAGEGATADGTKGLEPVAPPTPIAPMPPPAPPSEEPRPPEPRASRPPIDDAPLV